MIDQEDHDSKRNRVMIDQDKDNDGDGAEEGGGGQGGAGNTGTGTDTTAATASSSTINDREGGRAAPPPVAGPAGPTGAAGPASAGASGASGGAATAAAAASGPASGAASGAASGSAKAAGAAGAAGAGGGSAAVNNNSGRSLDGGSIAPDTAPGINTSPSLGSTGSGGGGKASTAGGGMNISSKTKRRASSRRAAAASGKMVGPGAAVLGRDGRDMDMDVGMRYERHRDDDGNDDHRQHKQQEERKSRQQQQQQARKPRWRPPTPPEQEDRQRRLLGDFGGDGSNDSKGKKSWLGGFFSSSASSSTSRNEAAAAGGGMGINRPSSAVFNALGDDGSDMGIHPEDAITAAKIARSSRSTKKSRLVRNIGNAVGGKKQTKGHRHLLQQHDDDDDEDGDYSQADRDDFNRELQESGQRIAERIAAAAASTNSSNADAEEKVRDECSFFYTGFDDPNSTAAAKDQQSGASRFGTSSRRGGGGRSGTTRRSRPFGSNPLDRNSSEDVYYAASGEDGSMGLDIEAGYHDAEERDAFLSRYESLNAHIPLPSKSSRRAAAEAAGIHTAILPGRDHELRLEEGTSSAEDDDNASSASASSSMYNSAMSSLHSMVGAATGGVLGLAEPPSPRSTAIRSDSLRQSSLLYIHSESGRVQLRLPNDNVRLLMDPHLEPGILSVERIGGGKGSDDKGRPDLPFMPRIGLSRSQDDDHDALESAALEPFPSRKKLLDDGSNDDEDEKMDKQINGKTKDSVASSCPWQDTELSYVLTVDEDLYRRLVKEMADSKVMCGLYYCCHQTDGDENRVNIGIALCVLFVVFTFLLVETIIHPH